MQPQTTAHSIIVAAYNRAGRAGLDPTIHGPDHNGDSTLTLGAARFTLGITDADGEWWSWAEYERVSPDGDEWDEWELVTNDGCPIADEAIADEAIARFVAAAERVELGV